jgi:hypothetical protein
LRSGEIEMDFTFSKPFQWRLLTFFALMLVYYQKQGIKNFILEILEGSMGG